MDNSEKIRGKGRQLFNKSRSILLILKNIPAKSQSLSLDPHKLSNTKRQFKEGKKTQNSQTGTRTLEIMAVQRDSHSLRFQSLSSSQSRHLHNEQIELTLPFSKCGLPTNIFVSFSRSKIFILVFQPELLFYWQMSFFQMRILH